MARIAELSPVIAEASNSASQFVNGAWNSRDATSALAAERGHTYVRLPGGPVSREQLDVLLEGADALVFAAANPSPPGDGETAGRILGERLLELLNTRRPLHLVYFSNFIVGHGVAHRNGKSQHRAHWAIEAQIRAGSSPWTILRQTWFAQVHDESYRTRLTQDLHADGFSTSRSIAEAIIAAIENPGSAIGRTASVFTVSIPAGSTDLQAQLADLEPDFEARYARQPVAL